MLKVSVPRTANRVKLLCLGVCGSVCVRVAKRLCVYPGISYTKINTYFPTHPHTQTPQNIQTTKHLNTLCILARIQFLMLLKLVTLLIINSIKTKPILLSPKGYMYMYMCVCRLNPFTYLVGPAIFVLVFLAGIKTFAALLQASF